MIGREMAEICKTCDNIDKCSPRGYICPALQILWSRGLEEHPEETKRKFLCLRRVFTLWKEGKYTDSELLHFLAGWCHFAPQGEEVKLLHAFKGDKTT